MKWVQSKNIQIHTPVIFGEFRRCWIIIIVFELKYHVFGVCTRPKYVPIIYKTINNNINQPVSSILIIDLLKIVYASYCFSQLLCWRWKIWRKTNGFVRFFNSSQTKIGFFWLLLLFRWRHMPWYFYDKVTFRTNRYMFS